MQDEKMNKEETVLADPYKKDYEAFIDMAAHDLQAPLRKLGVLVDRLSAKYKNISADELAQYSNRIHASIRELISLVEGFTELAKAIPGAMHYETCDLGQIVERILLEMGSRVKEKQAAINITALPLIHGDKTQLRALFKKIIENALGFSKEGIPLKIGIHAEKMNGNENSDLQLPVNKTFYKITVTDNGIGFTEEDKEIIFQPMVRLQGKSAFPGNGLGLALVKKIAANHQGIVYAEINKDEGSRIILIIPDKP